MYEFKAVILYESRLTHKQSARDSLRANMNPIKPILLTVPTMRNGTGISARRVPNHRALAIKIEWLAVCDAAWRLPGPFESLTARCTVGRREASA